MGALKIEAANFMRETIYTGCGAMTICFLGIVLQIVTALVGQDSQFCDRYLGQSGRTYVAALRQLTKKNASSQSRAQRMTVRSVGARKEDFGAKLEIE